MISAEDRRKLLQLISDIKQETNAPIRLICRSLRLSTSTYYRWINHPDADNITDGRKSCKRPPNPRALTAEEKERVLKRFNEPDVRDLTPEQAWFYLAERNEYYCSASTVRRLLRKEGITGKQRRDNIRNNRLKGYHPKMLKATRPNEVWTWDGTPYKDRWGNAGFMVYAAVDVYSRKIVHIDVFDSDNAENAVAFLSRAFDINHIVPGTLTLHSDNGSAMRAEKTMQLLKSRGVSFSHSRPRVSNDNPFSESVFATLNIRKGGDLRRYNSLEECRKIVSQLADEYNNDYHSGINFCTPNARHEGRDNEQLEKRYSLLAAAKAAHPERWINGRIMNCKQIGAQYLNPSDRQDDKDNDS